MGVTRFYHSTQEDIRMILYDEQNKTYTLHTQNTTYQMKIWDYNILLHV